MDADTYWQVLSFLGKVTEEDTDSDNLVMDLKPIRKNTAKALLLDGHRRLQQDWIMVCQDVEKEYTFSEVALRQDLAANKARWYGLWTKDLWCFLRNNNPFFAMFFSHRLHPVSRCSRWAAFGMQFLFVLFLSCAVTEGGSCLYCGIHECGQRSICKGGDQEDARFVETAWMKSNPQKNYCCFISEVWILWFLETFGRPGGPIYMVLLNCVFNIVVFQLLMCLCVQQSGPRVREGGELLGKALIIVMVAGMAYGLPTLVRYIWYNHAGWFLLGNFLTGKIASMFFVTLLNVIAFSFLWRSQQPKDEPSGRSQGASSLGTFHVTAEDYQAFCDSSRLHEKVEPCVSCWASDVCACTGA